jgi:hypothetical protein
MVMVNKVSLCCSVRAPTPAHSLSVPSHSGCSTPSRYELFRFPSLSHHDPHIFCGSCSSTGPTLLPLLPTRHRRHPLASMRSIRSVPARMPSHATLSLTSARLHRLHEAASRQHDRLQGTGTPHLVQCARSRLQHLLPSDVELLSLRILRS